ncbi:MAG: hypothetical protein CMIDDMOC_00673 [Sodalis sp. Fle]|nr:MAG: hypothetical protein CMIDDMOC_00673 [Sodalis sp. Fle]
MQRLCDTLSFAIQVALRHTVQLRAESGLNYFSPYMELAQSIFLPTTIIRDIYKPNT